MMSGGGRAQTGKLHGKTAWKDRMEKTDQAAVKERLPSLPLARLRLLVALDALLVEGSVSGAARVLGLSTPAASRLLAQLRALYGDQILIRTGRGMVATPFAEQLRGRLRALADEADSIVRLRQSAADGVQIQASRQPIVQNPPLLTSPTPLIEGQPDPLVMARRLAEISDHSGPKERLARYIAVAGGGAGRPRPLSRSEAEDALGIIIDGEAHPVQIGALMVALQYRGVNATELAGLVSAARRKALPLGTQRPEADIDWPAYLSPRTTTPPWFLLAARLVAQAGYRVVLHGFARGGDRLHEALDAAAIPYALSIKEAQQVLVRDKIVYLPLTAIDPQLQALIGLYRLFQMRSPMNLAVQLLNPLGASASVLGVPSAAQRMLQLDAAALQGWRRLVAVASNRDVAQATSAHAMPLMVLDNGNKTELKLPARSARNTPKSQSGFTMIENWLGLWTGAVRDEDAVATVISTAAIALSMTMETVDLPAAHKYARQLWENRNR